jgi:5-methylcytosine-specific restriction protein A
MASGQWQGSTRRGSLPPDWPRVRQSVLKHASRVCAIRGPMCIVTATEVDHIGSRDNHDRSNLRASCKPCHQDRSSSQGGQAAGRARRAMLVARKRPTERHPGEA